MIAGVTFGLLALTLTVALVGFQALRSASDTRSVHAQRATAVFEHASQLLAALVGQEAGLRGYLATGEQGFLDPYHAGEHAEREARARLWVALDALGERKLRPLALELVAAIDDWHRTIASPEIERRRAGPLPDLERALVSGKTSFDKIRATHAPLMSGIAESTARSIAEADKAADHTLLVLAVMIAAVLVIAIFATRYLFRHAVRPLTELAERAEKQQPFQAPRADEPIRELYALQRALAQLDDTVRLREAEVEQAHGEAVSLAKFGELAQQLADEDELHDTFQRVIDRMVAPARMHILARNASKNRLEVVRPQMPVEDQLRFPILSEPMKCRAVRTLREVVANADAPTACRCELGVPRAGSYLCVPMLAAGELIGVTNLQAEAPDHFTPEHVQTVQSYAGFAGATLSSLRLIAATRERALRDGLTGAYNRAFLSEYLSKTLASTRRRGARLAALMVDLDHFKKINDQHGHLVGDQAIVALARCLQAQTRASDAVVRYGGEEFAVLLIDVTVDGARQTAERIRHAIEATHLLIGGIEYGPLLRASIGVAVFPDHAADEHALLTAADAALYRAKRAGRNQVSVAPELTAATATAAAGGGDAPRSSESELS